MSELAAPRPRRWRSLRRSLGVAAVVVVGLAVGRAARGGDFAEDRPATRIDAGLVAAWRTLRAFECGRCHGKDYDGLAAPSIVEYARLVDRDLFMRKILDGDPVRGMPGYRDIAPVAERIDDIYRYFVARANETLDAASMRAAAIKSAPEPNSPGL